MMANTIYVLRAKEWPHQGGQYWDGYWTGETYTFQKEKYAVVDRDLRKAKKYQSHKRAETSAERMVEYVCNYVFTVEEEALP